MNDSQRKAMFAKNAYHTTTTTCHRWAGLNNPNHEWVSRGKNWEWCTKCGCNRKRKDKDSKWISRGLSN